MMKEVQPKARTMGVDMVELTLLPNVICSCKPLRILYTVGNENLPELSGHWHFEAMAQ